MAQLNKINIYNELDPVVETIGLLFLLVTKDVYKKQWIEDYNDIGINGELFYEKHMGYIDVYVSEFEKHSTKLDDLSFFVNTSDFKGDTQDRYNFFFSVMFFVLRANKEWITDFESVTEEAILDNVISLIAPKSNLRKEDVTLYTLRTTDKFIHFLDECEIEERDKWKLLQLYCQPKQLFEKWINIIAANIQAFEKAVKKVQPTMQQLLEGYKTSVLEQKLNAYKNIVEGIHESVYVYPSLVFPDSLSVFKNNIYYGLLLDSVPLQNDNPEEIKEFLLIRLKALSDMSKLQIMMMLKQGEKYNLEIAEQLGITAATTSHHMNLLLATGLVGINKQNGKVFYHLEKEGIKHFVEKLEQFLM